MQEASVVSPKHDTAVQGVRRMTALGWRRIAPLGPPYRPSGRVMTVLCWHMEDNLRYCPRMDRLIGIAANRGL
jgi:hypothetical protein